MSKIQNSINKIGELNISLKWIITFLITLLIVCYFFKEQVLFEDLLKILVPFLVGASMKVSYYFVAGLV
jgi:glucan phosphoethanolaminetransferase (alkaline phosphatase superfamily)